MKFILSYWMFLNAQVIATPAPLPFDDEKACKAALEKITEDWQGAGSVGSVSARRIVGNCHAVVTPTNLPGRCVTIDGEMYCAVQAVPTEGFPQ